MKQTRLILTGVGVLRFCRRESAMLGDVNRFHRKFLLPLRFSLPLAILHLIEFAEIITEEMNGNKHEISPGFSIGNSIFRNDGSTDVFIYNHNFHLS